MSKNRVVFEKGEGVLHLTPTWVPRGFNEPGHRLRLHPDDYFAFGMDRGAIWREMAWLCNRRTEWTQNRAYRGHELCSGR